MAGIIAQPGRWQRPRPGLRPTAAARLRSAGLPLATVSTRGCLTARNTARTPLPGGRRLAPDSAGSRRFGMPVTPRHSRWLRSARIPAVRGAPVIGRHGRHGAPERTFCRAVEVRVRRILPRSCVVRGAGHLQPDGVRVSPHGDGRARHRVNQHQTCPPQARKPLKADGRTMPPGARNLVPGRHKSGSVIGLSPQAASAPAA